ncbi:hypothetical protein EL436_13490 [Enterococcus faecalis]|uniref:hypothetical protein n=1 Tax=Enterococcus faecalis TaxID=1351 RepID=UPI0019DF42B3|nr:hypothetical protein [Enterococcus faecalis]EGO6520120.1 hypothetical protein [Enterococcus faecalis]EGO8159735.1 hypothetical protein [Enterococcus faecalis]EGO8184480.1 hypothetical protein [Enterococcus faecalis]EGO8482205.1 hypothetical protein [Enterococcus faecalis]
MAITQKELNKKKIMAKLLLEAKGKNFDECLASKYDEVFDENQEAILDALKQSAKTSTHNNY